MAELNLDIEEALQLLGLSSRSAVREALLHLLEQLVAARTSLLQQQGDRQALVSSYEAVTESGVSALQPLRAYVATNRVSSSATGIHAALLRGSPAEQAHVPTARAVTWPSPAALNEPTTWQPSAGHSGQGPGMPLPDLAKTSVLLEDAAGEGMRSSDLPRADVLRPNPEQSSWRPMAGGSHHLVHHSSVKDIRQSLESSYSEARQDKKEAASTADAVNAGFWMQCEGSGNPFWEKGVMLSNATLQQQQQHQELAVMQHHSLSAGGSGGKVTVLEKFNWEQSRESVKIYVPLRGVHTTKLEALFQPTSAMVLVKELKGRDYCFSVPQTYGAIFPAACSAVASKSKKNILITLQKLGNPGFEQHWPALHRLR